MILEDMLISNEDKHTASGVSKGLVMCNLRPLDLKLICFLPLQLLQSLLALFPPPMFDHLW